jgi:hypothetical protein
MDIESLLGGGGSGLVASIVAAFGFNRRLKYVESCKQEKSLCEERHKGTDKRLDRIEQTQHDIFSEIKDLNDYVRNRK